MLSVVPEVAVAEGAWPEYPLPQEGMLFAQSHSTLLYAALQILLLLPLRLAIFKHSCPHLVRLQGSFRKGNTSTSSATQAEAQRVRRLATGKAPPSSVKEVVKVVQVWDDHFPEGEWPGRFRNCASFPLEDCDPIGRCCQDRTSFVGRQGTLIWASLRKSRLDVNESHCPRRTLKNE